MAIITFLELQEITYRYLSEDTTDTSNPKYPVAWVKRLLNTGMSHIVRRLDNSIFKTSTTVTADSSETALPADYLCHGIFRFGATSNDRRYLIPITEDWLDERNPNWRDDTGTTPSHIIIKANMDGTIKYRFYPLLDADVASGLFMSYTQKPTDMTVDASTPTILTLFPEVQETILPYYALSNLYLFENGAADDRAALYEAKFERELTKMRMAIKSIAKYYSKHV